MKTLLTTILILLSITVFTQQSEHIVKFNDEIQEYQKYQDSLITASICRRLAKILTEYEEHCYNDSTLKEVYIDPNYNITTPDGWTFRTAMAGYYEKQWIHKEPTFKGFINWLKK